MRTFVGGLTENRLLLFSIEEEIYSIRTASIGCISTRKAYQNHSAEIWGNPEKKNRDIRIKPQKGAIRIKQEEDSTDQLLIRSHTLTSLDIVDIQKHEKPSLNKSLVVCV